MNTFFRKAPQRKWTWMSPDGTTKNEIDFVISDKKNTVQDVTVFNKYSVGSDYRLFRAIIKTNVRGERTKIVLCFPGKNGHLSKTMRNM